MMTIEPIEGTPFFNWPGNYTPPQHPQLASIDLLSGPAAGDAGTIAKNYLVQNGSALGVSATDISKALVTNQYTDKTTGFTHVYLQQTFNGLPIADAHANVSLTANGRVIAANASFVTGLAHPPTNSTPTPTIGVQQALDVFAQGALIANDGLENVSTSDGSPSQQTTINDPELSVRPIIARLQYVPSPGGGVDLGWQIIAQPPGMANWFDMAVGASGPRTAEVTRVADWVNNATYTVFAQPIQDPLYGNQSVAVDPQDVSASPFGWHDTNFLPGADTAETTGNNVRVTTGTAFGPSTQGPNLNFNFNFDQTQGPAVQPNQDAAQTNLFYWVNLAHDIAFNYGFDEAAGNFQLVNRSGVGVPSDPVLAIDQFQFFPGIPLLNNAFMATPPDGQSPTMGVGVATPPPGFPLPLPPNRNVSFDNGTTMHEFMHGISNRLTGGPANANALQSLQSGGMGEGWGDWFELITTMKPGDAAGTARTSSVWFAFQPLGGPGIRRFPYSFDMSINPLTLGDYNGDLFPQQNNSEVHNAGEIWTSALWDMTWLLINKYGISTDLFNGTGGNNVALQLVFEGMKLQPVNPDFLEARDAIIAADLALNGGENYELIWSAFARRGFGVSASTPGANSLFVTEAFDVPQPLGHVRGTVFNDVDGDGRRDVGDQPLPGITVYHDANQNARLDAGERQFVTRNDGSYGLAFVTTQLAHIRQNLTSEFKQTFPANNGPRVVVVTAGQTINGIDFGNQATPGKIQGVVFNDLNANSVQDVGERPIGRVMVYIDYNGDGKVSITEPSTFTDDFGRWQLVGIPPGSNHLIRQVLPPGSQQTFPGPTAAVPFTHVVTVLANQTVTGFLFGNTTSEDFGDAPDSYGTTLAAKGARHGILPGLKLGALLDGEVDGQPLANAGGDDANPPPPNPLPVPPPPSPDDEDGIVFIGGGISPGTTGTIQVTASWPANNPGRLHGWIDYDQDGKFESDERVVANLLMSSSPRIVSFQVPSTALQGSTYARFRYGYESDLGPTGPSVAGEVEDYQLIVLPSTPVAVPDVFPLAGQPLIRPDSVDYVLDVLANDPSTVFGPPQIVPGSFPSTLPGTGSTLELSADGRFILYTAGPNVEPPTQETFTYRVTDGRTVSAPGLVIINVSLANPVALDDAFTLTASDVAGVQAQLPVMLNDLFPQPDTVIVGDPVFLPLFAGDTQDTTLSVNGLNQTVLDFNAPLGFRGTEVFQYTIDDTDPTTAPASALVTVQVVPATPTDEQLRSAGYLAILKVQLLDDAGQPTSALAINQDATFSVRVTARDLRTGGDASNRGVQAAYLDLLFDRTKVTPVSITFDPAYNELRSGELNEPAPGNIDEVGATDTVLPPPGQGEETVFTVVLRAIGSTLGQPTQIVGDPADELELSDIVLAAEVPGDPDPDKGSPVVLNDAQVFLQPSGNITIFGDGEGEFVNRVNPLDVNQDTIVSAGDVLDIINTLNAGGAQSLRGLTGGIVATAGMVDANMDSVLSSADALAVINYINSRSHRVVASEGEAAVAGGGADSGLPSPVESQGSDGMDTTGSTAETTASDDVDAAAVDDLMADLAESRTELKRRYQRR